MTAETQVEPAEKAELLRERIVVGVIAAVLLVFWMSVFRGPMVLAVTAAIGAIMVTELFLMIAHQRYLYAIVVAALTAAAIWFSGRDALGVAALLVPLIFVIGWFVAPASWRVLFPVYVVVLTIGCLSVFLLRETGLLFSFWPALIAVATGVGAYAGKRLFGGGTVAGLVLAAVAGAVAAPFLEPEHSVLFWIIASAVLAVAALAGDAAEVNFKRRAGVVWASDILPGYGGLLDLFKGMIITFALANLAVMAGII